MAFLDRYPPSASEVVFSSNFVIKPYNALDRLHLDLPGWIWASSDIMWSLHATIFNFPFDPSPPTSLPSTDIIFTVPSYPVSLFEDRFFEDSSRSKHHSATNRQCISVAQRCLLFLIQQTFPLPSGFYRPMMGTNNIPWLKRVRMKISARGFYQLDKQLRRRLAAQGQKTMEQNADETRLKKLLGLLFALFYLPPLLETATITPDLVALAKLWRSRPYFHFLYPREAKLAEKAVVRYLRRYETGYVYFIES